MAMQFSQGLLGGLRQFGQGGNIPSDPRQQNAMQRAGVTNPLLQQFGQSLGGLFGQDMRSQAEIAQQEIAKVAMGGTPAQKKETAQKLLAMGMSDEALKLNQVADAEMQQQISESQAMQTANAAYADGLLTREVRDNYLRGIGTKAVDPSAVVNNINNLRMQDDKSKQAESSLMQFINQSADRGEISVEKRDSLLRGVASGTVDRGRIGSEIQAEKEKTVKATNLIKFAETELGGLKETTKQAITDGVLTSARDIRAVEKNEDMVAPVEVVSILQEVAGGKDEKKAAIAKARLEELKGGKEKVNATTIDKALVNINEWRNEEIAAQNASAGKGSPVAALSKNEIKEYDSALDVDPRISKVLDSLYDEGWYDTVSDEEKSSIYAQAEQAHALAAKSNRAITREQALLQVAVQKAVNSFKAKGLTQQEAVAEAKKKFNL